MSTFDWDDQGFDPNPGPKFTFGAVEEYSWPQHLRVRRCDRCGGFGDKHKEECLVPLARACEETT